MAARFYGSVENGSQFVEDDNGILSTTEVVANQQEYQATMLACDEINKEMKNLRMEVASLKTTIEELRSENKEINQVAAKTSGKLPEGLSRLVHRLHDSLENQFNSSELYRSTHNQAVAEEIVIQIMSQERNKFSEKCVQRGVHRFYESRRRIFNDSRPDRQERVKLNLSLKKKRGYQKRLFQRRGRCLESEREKKMWGQLSEIYMTEESEDEEAGIVRKHHMLWQSDVLREAKAVLDERVKRKGTRVGQFASKERITSSPSTSPVPSNPVKWAINRLYLNNSAGAFDEIPSGRELPNRSSIVNGNASTNRRPSMYTQVTHLRSDQESTSVRNSVTREENYSQQFSRDSIESRNLGSQQPMQRTPESRRIPNDIIRRSSGTNNNFTTPMRYSGQHHSMPPGSLFSPRWSFGHSSSSHSDNSLPTSPFGSSCPANNRQSGNSHPSSRINGTELTDRFFGDHSSGDDDTDY